MTTRQQPKQGGSKSPSSPRSPNKSPRSPKKKQIDATVRAVVAPDGRVLTEDEIEKMKQYYERFPY
jgi:hypothetical protein